MFTYVTLTSTTGWKGSTGKKSSWSFPLISYTTIIIIRRKSRIVRPSEPLNRLPFVPTFRYGIFHAAGVLHIYVYNVDVYSYLFVSSCEVKSYRFQAAQDTTSVRVRICPIYEAKVLLPNLLFILRHCIERLCVYRDVS